MVVGRALPSLEGRVGVGEVDRRASSTEDLMPNLAYLLLSISNCVALCSNFLAAMCADESLPISLSHVL